LNFGCIQYSVADRELDRRSNKCGTRQRFPGPPNE
jgi:hypothetical protein